MGVIIVLLVIGTVFFIFVMKGESGKSFSKTRKEIHKTVKQKGGMYELYQEFVDYFKDQGFQIREINKDSIYLHYGTWDGKVGIQILQTTPKEAKIIVGCELPSGKSHNTSIKVNIKESQFSMIDRLNEKFSDGQLSDFESIAIDFNKSNSVANGKKQESGLSISKKYLNDSDELIGVKNYYRDYLEEKEVASNNKQIIEVFFLPDRVNPQIYYANYQKIDGVMIDEISEDEVFISPKLREYYESNGTIPMGIPNWFVAAYPDVLFWFTREGGIKIIERKFESISKDELIEDNLIKKEILRTVIDLYKENVTNKLETSIPLESHY